MLTEVWKDVVNYEGLYQVSNLGRVKGVKSQRILKASNSGNCGYEKVGIFKNGKVKYMSTHRLVAIAFIPNPDNLPQVNHKDEVKTNNFVENLEFCTNIYNMNYGTIQQRKGNSNGKPVIQKTLDGKTIATYNSIKEAGVS